MSGWTRLSDLPRSVLFSRGNLIVCVAPSSASTAAILHIITRDHRMPETLLSSGDSKNSLPYSRPVTPDHGRRVGIYGLGAIGYPVAKNLANSLSSLPIVVYNRTPTKSEKLAKELGPNKISIANTPADLVNSCDIMCAMFVSKLMRSPLTHNHQFHNPRK